MQQEKLPQAARGERALCTVLGSERWSLVAQDLASRLQFKEVADELVAGLCEDAFGVELHAFNGQMAVAQPHNYGAACAIRFRGTRRNGKVAGQRVLCDDQGVVTGADERGGQAGKDTLAVVLDRACLAMHQALCAHHLASKGFTDGLVAQANAENGRLAGHVSYERDQDAGFAGRTRAGREQNAVGVHRLDLFYRQFVIASDHDLRDRKSTRLELQSPMYLVC